MTKKGVLYLAVFFIFASGIVASAQSIGKIFSKADADSAFGKVFYSQTIGKAKLDSLISDSTNVLMFRVTETELIILNKDRITVYPDNRKVDKSEPYFAYTKDKIKELINSNKDNAEVLVEARGSTTTLTYGNLTVEQSALCPPFCP